MPRTSRRTGSAAVNSPAASDIFRSGIGSKHSSLSLFCVYLCFGDEKRSGSALWRVSVKIWGFFSLPWIAALHINGATSRAVSKELERIDVLFQSYSDSSSGMIGPEGIESLCSDVGVEHTDIRMLMLAWKMRAEKQGYFTLEEWRGGLKALRSDSINKLKKALTELEKEVRSPENFPDFYSYAFRYCLTEEKQRSIDIESTCELLDLILGSVYRPQISKLTEYLKGQSDYKVINLDQWMGFLRFCKEINFPSLDNYDPAFAWPLILDNFVEWMQQHQHRW